MYVKIDCQNQTSYLIDSNLLDFLEKIFDEIMRDIALEHKQCELIFVNDKDMQALNFEYRNKNETTDVLSFPLDCKFSSLLGSVVISLDYANGVAQRLKHSLEAEIALLFVHGILHLVGFDHERDEGEQRAKEEEIIKKFNLPASLIVRNS